MRLKDVGEIKSGKAHSAYGAGNVPVYMSGGVVAHIDTAMDEGPAVIVSIRGLKSSTSFHRGRRFSAARPASISNAGKA